MKKICFPYCISYGKWDDEYLEITVGLTDEEEAALAKAAKEDGGMGFQQNESVQEIYDTVYFAVIDGIKEDLKRDPSPVEDMLSWEDEDYDPDEHPITEDDVEQYIDELDIKVYYPRANEH